jgi:hypothetical protein
MDIFNKKEKKNKKGSKNTEIVNEEKKEEEDDNETEMAVLPMRLFTALIANKDSVISKYDEDRIRLACELKGTQEQKALYIQAHEREKNKKLEYKNKCDIQEKELNELRNKTKPNPKINDILTKSKSIIEIENRDEVLDKYYKKHYAPEVAQLRTQLGLDD